MGTRAMKFTALLGVLLVGLSIAGPAAAQHGGRGGWHGEGGGWGGWGLGLGLGLGLGAAVLADPYRYDPGPGYYYPPAQPVVIVQAPGPQPYPAEAGPGAYGAAPAATVWYYCDPARAYYPYVSTCNVPWRMVPAAPPAPVR